jgi:hypothetical protein
MPIFEGGSVTIAIALVPFAIFVLFYLIYSAFTLYHMIRFGVYGFSLYAMSLVYALGSLALLLGSLYVISSQDWSATIDLPNLLAGPDETFFQL